MKISCHVAAAVCVALGLVGHVQGQTAKAGAATYALAPKGGDKGMPAALGRTNDMMQRAAPTNQWYSTLMFNPKPEVIFAQPLTYQFTPAGLELALPTKEVLPTERRDVEIHYRHRNPIVISPTAFELGQAKVAGIGDWSVDVSMARGSDDMKVTIAHGSPFASIRLSRGDVKLKLPAAAERFGEAADARVLALRIAGKSYALFGPLGVRWEPLSATEWVGHLPEGKGYVSAAGLPDDKAETLALFTRHAYAFIEGTRVEWAYEPSSSQVVSTFKATTKAMEGEDRGPLLGLYPHQWFNNASVEGKLGPTYDSIRGKIKLLAAGQFKTTATYTGFVPYWPGLKEGPRVSEITDLMSKDMGNARRMMLQEGQGAYWQGKGLQRTLNLLNVAEQQGDMKARDQLLAMMKKRVEEWFSGESAKSYFAYNKSMGAMASYPDEFFTVEQINDHHFTYGYWIRTVAEIALRDPAWAAKSQWGGLIDLMVADIATTERGRADFPFIRNFDAYEGHSWASGIGIGGYGNNQESSSEAINAWAGLIMWAEVNGDKALRDVGVFLYTTEVQAINHYWFDIYGLTLPPEYKNVEVSQVFGGALLHNTWWTDEPRQIKGINLLPVTTASLYLGTDPKYVKRNLDALKVEMDIYAARGRKPPNPPPADIWQDVFAKYAAIGDPAQGLALWDRWGSVELGESRTGALHFLLSLNEMGAPDFSVRADTPLFSVFKRPDGHKTYLAFNASKTPLNVKFTDGTQLSVAPGTLGRATSSKP